MSVATVQPGDYDDTRLEFDLLVADFDQADRPARRSRAAERREGREQIAAQLGRRRHRSHEREA